MIKSNFYAVLFMLITASACFCQDSITQTVPQDRLQRVYEATVRVSVSGGIGTGTVFHEDKDHYYILTNEHVVSGSNTAKIEFSKAHWPSNKITGKVIGRRHTNGLTIDVAIIRITKKSVNFVDLPVIPIGRVAPTMDTRLLLTCGCQAGAKPSLQQCVIVERQNNLIKYRPTSLPGRSGSALTDTEGKVILGLVAWMSGGSNSVGMAMTCTSIHDWCYSVVDPNRNSSQSVITTVTRLPQDAVEIPLAPATQPGNGNSDILDYGTDVDLLRLFRRRNYPPKKYTPSAPKKENPLTDEMDNPFNQEDMPEKKDELLDAPEYGPQGPQQLTPGDGDKLTKPEGFQFELELDLSPKSDKSETDLLNKKVDDLIRKNNQMMEMLMESNRQLQSLIKDSDRMKGADLLDLPVEEMIEEEDAFLFRRWLLRRRYYEPYPNYPPQQPYPYPYPQPEQPQADPDGDADRLSGRLMQRFFNIPIIGSILRTISFLISISIWIVFIIIVDWIATKFFGSSWLGKLLAKVFNLVSQLIFGAMSVFKHSDADYLKSRPASGSSSSKKTVSAPAPQQTSQPIIVNAAAQPQASDQNSLILRELQAEVARMREEIRKSNN